MTKLEKIRTTVLSLPVKERFELADNLLGSLPSKAIDLDEDMTEILRRNLELESGRVKPLSETAFWSGIRRTQGQS
jgi:putative addiction module component (TIGR02574 family)